MKKRFSEEQIIGFLHEAEAGMPVKALRRDAQAHRGPSAATSSPPKAPRRDVQARLLLPRRRGSRNTSCRMLRASPSHVLAHNLRWIVRTCFQGGQDFVAGRRVTQAHGEIA